MSKHRTLDDCRSGKDFIGYAETHGGHVDRQVGSHAVVKSPSGGICPVPVHNGDLPTGTRRSIVKLFMAIGLAGMILVALFELI